MTTPVEVPLIALLLLVVICVVLAVVLTRLRRRVPVATDEPTPAAQVEVSSRRAAFVVNPTKLPDLDAVHDQVVRTCASHGWSDPLWLLTTVDDPGRGQAAAAIEEGVDLVCALGGDGTVRAVAEGMIHSGIPLGLLPAGTGNLLARNLDLPLDSLDEALRIALTGQDRLIDVGQVAFDLAGEATEVDSTDVDSTDVATTEAADRVDRVFLVMAGIGFDAAMMAGVTDQLKARVGWLAYVLSGVQNIGGPRARVRMSTEAGPEATRRVRTVIIGNCGRLTGGIVLFPDAEVDDGWLDVVALSPRGVVSWASMGARVLSRRSDRRIGRRRCREVTLHCDPPQQAQLDGDTIGTVRALQARVDPDALLMRTRR